MRPVATALRIVPVRRTSLVHRLAERLGDDVARGIYRAGERLPSIGAMARGLGVATPTVRAALRELEAAGVVEVRHGAGVFVGAGARPEQHSPTGDR